MSLYYWIVTSCFFAKILVEEAHFNLLRPEWHTEVWVLYFRKSDYSERLYVALYLAAPIRSSAPALVDSMRRPRRAGVVSVLLIELLCDLMFSG